MTAPATSPVRGDVYARVTAKIITDLEQGVRPWLRPWSVEHAAGRITRPLRSNGEPYNGINVLMLWCEACDKGFSCPIWMTYKQALELGGRSARANTARSSSTPTASAKPRPPTMAIRSNAKSRS